MASSAYYTWVSGGKQYTLTKPARELELRLREYGYTVYDYPNEDHQTAVPPEDHTPYSATEWPVSVAAYIAHALDIMPPGATALARGAIPLPQLARRIIADRDARKPGTLFIKYMNWTDENGTCRRESWKTTPRTTTSSTDKGHIHLSGRTDTQSMSIGDWNPVVTAIDLDQDPDFTALKNRIYAMVQDFATYSYTLPGKPTTVETNKLRERLVAIQAQAEANGKALSELKALVVAGGVDPAELAAALAPLLLPQFELMVRDEVARLINATKLQLG